MIQQIAPTIDDETRRILLEQFAEGTRAVEREMQQLEGMGFEVGSQPGFFGIDRQRNEALIREMQQVQQRCESAALRTMDDVYRQTVQRAELAMAAGATTLPKAIDMATKDFLSKGINSIQYADGRRVNIADYVQMALRTAATRSKLQGEAARRAEYGINTVLVSQYGVCSDTCLPWQGRVYIDDVWGIYDGRWKRGAGKAAGLAYGINCFP